MNALVLIAMVALGVPDGAATRAEDLASHAPPSTARIADPAPGNLGPALVRIDELANLYEPVVFDHQLHVRMSEMAGGCANCHHDLGTSMVAAACISCHPATNGGTDLARPALKGAYHRQCLGCHRDWSHENACGFCHAEVGGGEAAGAGSVLEARRGTHDPTDIIGVAHPRLEASARYVYRTSHDPAPFVTFQHADHVEVFGMRCVDCHRGASCDVCHGPATEPRIVSRAETCFPCHAERRCVFCHDVSPRGRFDHAISAGWSLEPGHVDVACADCHGPERPFGAPSSAGCRACHGAGMEFEHGRIGIELTGSHAYFDCVCCHRGSDAGSDVSCMGCHADRSYPAWIPGVGPAESGAKRPARLPLDAAQESRATEE